MLCIYNKNTNPYFNLACEEYILKEFNEECFMLWRNSPCIVVGKNQNTLSEINKDYVDKNNITIVRRLSGGGAVFHDLGNINFTFISNQKETFNDFKRFTVPIIDALKQLNVNAEFSGRNDLTIDGKKFSGNAQYCYKNRVLHHGTLLFSANVKDISQSLNVKEKKFEGKAVKSVKSRVTNISSHLKSPMKVEEFIEFLMNYVVNNYAESKLYTLTEEDIKNIGKLADEKYSTWEWNYGSSPKYSYKNEMKCKGGLIEFNCNIEKGYIKDAKFFGDFFGIYDVSDIETALKGTKYTEDAVRNTLSKFNIENYFSSISLEQILKLMF
ncbi:MAG TPA: lipoate--protein ligase [Clostridiaceae bacterium]|jgi:lipoate-protein ligase A|nr:lipoate--protein ligase [Clostridiaceae bacterium]